MNPETKQNIIDDVKLHGSATIYLGTPGPLQNFSELAETPEQFYVVITDKRYRELLKAKHES